MSSFTPVKGGVCVEEVPRVPVPPGFHLPRWFRLCVVVGYPEVQRVSQVLMEHFMLSMPCENSLCLHSVCSLSVFLSFVF